MRASLSIYLRARTHTHTHTPPCGLQNVGASCKGSHWKAFPHNPDVFPHHGICTWIQSRCQVQIRTRHRVILFRGLRKKSPPGKNKHPISAPPFPPGPMLAATRVFLALRKKSPFMLLSCSLRCTPTLDLGGRGACHGVKFMSDRLFFRRPRNP